MKKFINYKLLVFFNSVFFIMLFLCLPVNSEKLSKSPFIPDQILNDFNSLPKDYKIRNCGLDQKINKPNKDKINVDLAPRIFGYNSRMDNWRKVEGNYSRDVFEEYSKAVSFAFVTEDTKIKEKLFNKLYYWAKNKALAKTKQCYTNKEKNSILSECEGEWSDEMGQDLAPIKDDTVAIEIVMGLNYIYNLYFSDFTSDDLKHKEINEWFKFFYKRIKPANKFYMGNSAGWYFPNIALRHNSGKNYTKLIKKMINGADKWVSLDGSIKDRTTRGNRALWYHHTGLGESFMILEMAKAANVEIPINYEKKLLKAAELFQDTFLDHLVIEPWAKKAHNSQPSNGVQKFNKNLDNITFNGPWFHIIQYRFPNHRTSKFIKSEMSNKARSLNSDEITGINMGCIYSSLANFKN